MTGFPTAGRHLVDTTTDTYDVDVDARIAVRLDLAAEAAGHHAQPEVFLFDTVELVDDVLMFDAASWPRVTDAVIGVTKAETSVTA